MNFAVKMTGYTMRNLFYFKLEAAVNMKENYSSWIGRDAHTGKGRKHTLIGIDITKRSLQPASGGEELYKVDFIFEGNKVLSAYEFLFYNSLMASEQAEKQNNFHNDRSN